MKKRTVYWLPKTGVLAVLSAVFMVCSAVVRIVWAAGEEALSRSTLWFQVLLPLAANGTFVAILFRDGRERLYRSAIPVWLGCVFFAVKALGFSSMIHTVLCLCLYALVAVLYTATVTGYVPTQKLLWLLFGLPMLYHIFVEDTQKADWPVHDWLPEISVLCCMAALLCISLAMKKRPVEEGAPVRRFGDRNDGRRLRSLSPIFAVSPYIMKTRNTSQNFIEDHIEVTEMERYIVEKRKAGMKNFGVLHVLLAAYVRTCARYPGLNRFIAGQKIFTRDREIEVNMTIKKEMSTDSPDTVIKVTFDPADTAEAVYERFNAKVQQVKDAPEDTSFDTLAGTFNLIPGLLLKFFVFLLQAWDYFGLLPRFLTKLSPFHGSLYITSMASLGIPPIYHHLYDFGNVPVFCSFGKKRRVFETQRDGTVAWKKYIDCNFVTDERIVDGFYFASALRYLHNLLGDPWQLDQPPEEVLRDQA
ncbi:hypothetical protein [uncultured Dysosmobacter sp.]|uniref:hypothetical protein n=1 Tax=uncultured Dysosmobacter sp. TaxID=2591384 RepID=UPI00261DEA8F|nr:hypothetical protein [uncultured Dysosmobacter sp.]